MTVASDEPAPVVPGDPELRSLLETARTIAVVGLSSKPDRHSYRVASYLQDVGYRIIPVNPSESQVLGERAHAALGEVRGPIDIVDVFRRPEHTPAIAQQAVDVGARALWLQLGIVNEESGRIARAGGLTVVMGVCLMVEHERLLG